MKEVPWYISNEKCVHCGGKLGFLSLLTALQLFCFEEECTMYRLVQVGSLEYFLNEKKSS